MGMEWAWALCGRSKWAWNGRRLIKMGMVSNNMPILRSFLVKKKTPNSKTIVLFCTKKCNCQPWLFLYRIWLLIEKSNWGRSNQSGKVTHYPDRHHIYSRVWPLCCIWVLLALKYWLNSQHCLSWQNWNAYMMFAKNLCGFVGLDWAFGCPKPIWAGQPGFVGKIGQELACPFWENIQFGQIWAAQFYF